MGCRGFLGESSDPQIFSVVRGRDWDVAATLHRSWIPPLSSINSPNLVIPKYPSIVDFIPISSHFTLLPDRID